MREVYGLSEKIQAEASDRRWGWPEKNPAWKLRQAQRREGQQVS